MAEARDLHVVCARCGAPCHYVKQDRVTIGSLGFIERVLTCSGCGVESDEPTYFLSAEAKVAWAP